MIDFYCGSCGKYKKIDLKIENGKRRPICKSCSEKRTKNANAETEVVFTAKNGFEGTLAMRKRKDYRKANESYKNGTAYIPR